MEETQSEEGNLKFKVTNWTIVTQKLMKKKLIEWGRSTEKCLRAKEGYKRRREPE